MELELWRILVLLFSSLLIGFIGGCVGIALGVVRVPIMTFLGIDPLVAAGSNLFVTLLGSIGGLWPAFTQKRIVWRVVILVGIPSLFGSFIGALYAGNFSQFILLILIGSILFLSAISIILVSSFELFKKDRNDSNEVLKIKIGKFGFIREGIIGVAIGFVGGAVGVALGVLRVPALVYILKMHPSLSGGTNLAITIIVSLFGFMGHSIGNNYDIDIIIIIGLSAVIGMYIGSRLAGSFDALKLRLGIGVLLLFVSPFVFYDAFTRIT